MDDAHDIDAVMPMHSLIEHSDSYSKMWEILSQYDGDEPTLNNFIIDFPADNNNSISLKFK